MKRRRSHTAWSAEGRAALLAQRREPGAVQLVRRHEDRRAYSGPGLWRALLTARARARTLRAGGEPLTRCEPRVWDTRPSQDVRLAGAREPRSQSRLLAAEYRRMRAECKGTCSASGGLRAAKSSQGPSSGNCRGRRHRRSPNSQVQRRFREGSEKDPGRIREGSEKVHAHLTAKCPLCSRRLAPPPRLGQRLGEVRAPPCRRAGHASPRTRRRAGRPTGQLREGSEKVPRGRLEEEPVPTGQQRKRL